MLIQDVSNPISAISMLFSVLSAKFDIFLQRNQQYLFLGGDCTIAYHTACIS
jgi:hypothetical protein